MICSRRSSQPRRLRHGGGYRLSSYGLYAPDYGLQTLPRIDALGSRQFLLALLPALCTVPSALRPLEPTPRTRRVRALDVGAGVGRVTSDTLLPLIDDVILLEPVEIFIREAAARGTAAEAGGSPAWRGISTREKSVTFVQGTLQGVDPAAPAAHGTVLARVGAPIKDTEEMDSGFDVVWCQWCLGHLTDADLVRFLRRAQAALRDAESVIVVKENLCSEGEDGQAKSVYDEQDSSLTRWALL
jgi:protein N-terminal methyltransferase